MKRYQILTSYTLEQMAAGVNHLISEGWLPLGNITLDTISDEWKYIQAMVKAATKKEGEV